MKITFSFSVHKIRNDMLCEEIFKSDKFGNMKH